MKESIILTIKSIALTVAHLNIQMFFLWLLMANGIACDLFLLMKEIGLHMDIIGENLVRLQELEIIVEMQQKNQVQSLYIFRHMVDLTSLLSLLKISWHQKKWKITFLHSHLQLRRWMCYYEYSMLTKNCLFSWVVACELKHNKNIQEAYGGVCPMKMMSINLDQECINLPVDVTFSNGKIINADMK